MIVQVDPELAIKIIRERGPTFNSAIRIFV